MVTWEGKNDSRPSKERSLTDLSDIIFLQLLLPELPLVLPASP